MRAREPDAAGHIERAGIRVGYEVFGSGEPTIVFPPIDPVVYSAAWKAQVPYLARFGRVVTIDPRGNGRSDRPEDSAAYADTEFAADTIDVLDRLGIERAVLIGICTSAWTAALVGTAHPDRVSGIVALSPYAPFLTPPWPDRTVYEFDAVPDTDQGWARQTKSYYQKDYRGFLEFFAAQILPEPHSTKQAEDFISWGLQSTVAAQIASHQSSMSTATRAETAAVLRAIRCPVLVLHGDDDRCQPFDRGVGWAELTGGQRVVLHGAGHLPQAREPVVINLAIRDFVTSLPAPSGAAAAHPAIAPAVPAIPAAVNGAPPVRSWTRPINHPRRVLYLSSPIGLGHARRDLAIARALREQCPGIEIDWLTQHPVTAFLESHGERVHPASADLINESAWLESDAGEHDLDVFSTIRDMDAVQVNNFMVFADLVRSQRYDLWTGDEAWELDYFLHENPELKTAAYSWLSDFVGWLPMDAPDSREAELTADLNAEMLEQIDRLPRIRDRSLFVGNRADVIDRPFGPELPAIPDWVGEHFDFTGYITGFDPSEIADRPALRADFGFAAGEPVCVVAVGGSGVGRHLLRRCIDAYPAAARAVPGLRMVLVAGPRIAPESLLDAPGSGRRERSGIEIRGFVPDLHRMLAASDLAVVQGGLTTTMELTAAGRPFVYVPLQHHFEQNLHVRHRLANYRAGRCVTWPEADPDHLAAVIAQEIGRSTDYLPVETGGAQRAAAALAALV